MTQTIYPVPRYRDAIEFLAGFGFERDGDDGGRARRVARDGLISSARAGARGRRPAEVVMGLTDQPYGSREYCARDPEGNVWCFGTYSPQAAGDQPS